MEISGSTKVLGLIGSPVAHSLSPYIHNTLARHLSIDTAYVTFDVSPASLATAIAGAHALGIAGLNVTYPHKTIAANLAISLDNLAAQARAVNTLKYTPKGYIGYNTDIAGVKHAFSHHGISLNGKTAAIIGAGASACSAAIALAQMGCQKITITNRTLKNAETLATLLQKYYNVYIAVCAPQNFLKIESDALIYAAADNLGLSLDVSRHGAVFDINYRHGESSLIAAAKACGIATVTGLEMLVYQAVSAYEIFTDTKVPQNIAREITHSITHSSAKGQ